MNALGSLFFRPVTDKNGKVSTEFIGTVVGVDVRTADGTIQHFDAEPSLALPLQPVSWKDLDQLKKGQTVYIDNKPFKIERVFPQDGEVWVSDVLQYISHHKYFEIRIAK